MRNVAVIIPNGDHPSKHTGTISIGNIDATAGIVDFRFEAITTFNNDIPITEDAEIILNLGDDAWNKWLSGGMEAENIEIYNEADQQLRVTGPNAYLKNMTFGTNDLDVINVQFNFLTGEQPDRDYTYRVYQIRRSDGVITGGQDFDIYKPQRTDFDADAGNDRTIKDDESTNLSGQDIGENATYRWYDSDGELVHEGKNFSVSPANTETYKLEIIAESDGFKDYDEIVVNVKDKYILGMSPNPASSQVVLGYKASNASNAYISITSNGGPAQNHILDLNNTDITIDVSTLNTGVYNVVLICDGQAVDMKTLLVQ